MANRRMAEAPQSAPERGPSTKRKPGVGLPIVLIPHPHVRVDPNVLAGSPFVVGSRVPVRRLWSFYKNGATVEVLVRRYPRLGPGKVLDALAFGFDNREVVEADLAREEESLKNMNAHLEPFNADEPLLAMFADVSRHREGGTSGDDPKSARVVHTLPQDRPQTDSDPSSATGTDATEVASAPGASTTEHELERLSFFLKSLIEEQQTQHTERLATNMIERAGELNHFGVLATSVTCIILAGSAALTYSSVAPQLVYAIGLALVVPLFVHAWSRHRTSRRMLALAREVLQSKGHVAPLDDILASVLRRFRP